MIADRERWITQALIEMACELTDDFAVVDVLSRLARRCAELLDADVGIVLADEGGALQAPASSSERVHDLELIQIQNDAGPCLDAHRTGEVTVNAPLDGSRWAAFAARARAAGYRTVHAIPMRHQGVVIGAVNVFNTEPRPLSDADLELIQALAAMATISVLQHRAFDRATTVVTQLQEALDSRVAIEQAKGMVAARLQVSIDDAFFALRAYARTHNEKIGDVARDVLAGLVSAEALLVTGHPDPPGDGDRD